MNLNPFLIALGLGVIEIICEKQNKRFYRSALRSSAWSCVFKFRWALGMPLALCSLFVHYFVQVESTKYKAYGYPLAYTFFDEAGRNFVMPALIALAFISINALLWGFFPSVALWIWKLRVKK
jgi:hypothetical protein